MRRIAYAFAVLLIAPGLVVTDFGERSARARKKKRPNVLLIVTDDQRDGLDAMPTFRRRFIRGGRRYPNFFATTPQCCPARATILTGKYTHNHGVENNQSSQNLDPRTMLQYYLQRAGYRTGIFGKFLNSWRSNLSPPYFNKWATFERRNNPYYDAIYNVNGDVKEIKGYTTRVLTRLTRRFIRTSDANRDGKPWFAYVSPTAPHSPYRAEEKYRGAPVKDWEGNPAVFEKDDSDKPQFVQERSADLSSGIRRRRRQLRTLMSVDDMIQKFMVTLRKFNERNTIAIFVSDNGLLWAEHGVLTKNLPYQQSVNVPFFLRWPGRVVRGSRDGRLVGNIDITPTVLDAANIRLANPQFDGDSLLDQTWTRDRIHLEFFGPALSGAIPAWAATRTYDYQYTEYYDDNGDIEFREYYNLINDPWELNNHYEDDNLLNDPSPARTEEMHQQLNADRHCAEASCP